MRRYQSSYVHKFNKRLCDELTQAFSLNTASPPQDRKLLLRVLAMIAATDFGETTAVPIFWNTAHSGSYERCMRTSLNPCIREEVDCVDKFKLVRRGRRASGSAHPILEGGNVRKVSKRITRSVLCKLELYHHTIYLPRTPQLPPRTRHERYITILPITKQRLLRATHPQPISWCCRHGILCSG